LFVDTYLIIYIHFTESDVDDTHGKNVRHKRDAWYQRQKVGTVIIFMTDKCFIIETEFEAPCK